MDISTCRAILCCDFSPPFRPVIASFLGLFNFVFCLLLYLENSKNVTNFLDGMGDMPNAQFIAKPIISLEITVNSFEVSHGCFHASS
jgi:hypothetical protein